MSYAALSFGLGLDCPAGFSVDPTTGDCRAPEGSVCPNGFDQRTPGVCWPSTPTSCRDTFGTFFNPAEPDRCKKQCPTGTVPDSNNVCQSAPAMSPAAIGTIAIGILAVTIVLVGGSR